MHLLPCPFCGHPSPEIVVVPDQLELAFVGHCENCNMFGPEDSVPDLAAQLWNTRAPAPITRTAGPA
jgi:Lar family restriction alleviation protein